MVARYGEAYYEVSDSLGNPIVLSRSCGAMATSLRQADLPRPPRGADRR
jgi:hypothetical protein